MSARITFSCTRCGASVVTHSVAEVLAWDRTHKDTCIGGESR